jgi:hypothetical protein
MMFDACREHATFGRRVIAARERKPCRKLNEMSLPFPLFGSVMSRA